MTTPRLLSERYELGETLGYGGMSEVHRGRDVRLGREVAIKVLRADLARDPQFQHRFRKEAQNAAALNFPAIVAVYDTGDVESDYGPLPYIVMEFVDGRTLRDIIKTEGPMEEQQAVATMAEVCAALDFSHRGGIIHRDVKPANIMITTDGSVKVMDFGIARALADGQGVTQTAAVIGTAQYLSPEQARGERVDPRSDVYAAGCVLYELVTGEPPFTGDSPVAVAYQHVREDPRPPSQQNTAVSPAMDAIVLKAMSKNPANRYQTAAEMCADLVRLRDGQRPLAPTVMTDADRTTILAAPPTPSTHVLPPRRHRATSTRFDDRDPPPRRGMWVLAGIVAAAVIVMLLLVFTEVFGSGPAPAAVPDVVGQPVVQAQQTLTAAGFKTERNPVESTMEDIDRVVAQDPTGEALPGTVVRLDVGTGPAEVEVPNLVGLDLSQAEEALRRNDLVLASERREEVVRDEADQGRVVAHEPSAGTRISKGTAVVVTIGVAPQTVFVPDVVGTNVEQAERNIRGAGLTPQVEQADSDAPAGQVLQQNPAGGAEVESGSTVILTVSRGNVLEMPELTGLTPAEAEQALRQRGWDGTLSVEGTGVENENAIGRVISQSETPGTRITSDQAITVVVGEDADNNNLPTRGLDPPGGGRGSG